MSFRRSSVGTRSNSTGRQQQSRFYDHQPTSNASARVDSLPDVLPELVDIVRKLLPRELSFNMHVRDVDYVENGCERLTGTLYMTTFRLVFAPDNEIENRSVIFSGNKYIGEYDIPLTSIYRIDVGPVDSRSGFKSFLNENQIQSETRTFSVITRDFRHVTFTKCSVTKSNTLGGKQRQTTVTRMDTYIDALKYHTHFQKKEKLYPYLALQSPSIHHPVSRVHHNHGHPSMSASQSMDDDISDFCLSSDERIRSFLTSTDWKEELHEAKDQQWIVNRQKFDGHQIARDEGPYVYLASSNDSDGSADLIWHWTHTSDISHDHRRHMQGQQYMLVTVPGIGETINSSDPVDSPNGPLAAPSTSFRFLKMTKILPKTFGPKANHSAKVLSPSERRAAPAGGSTFTSSTTPNVGLRRAITETNLVASSHHVGDQAFQRYNLAKFPCHLKRLQMNFEKLMEICVIAPEDDDEKWWTKLNTCKWLKCVSKALHGAASLAKLLDYQNIELAGSEIDNSCLLSSLIQILLRPNCRTIKGFCELIVREWIIRGHPFRERFRQTSHDSNGAPGQESPVFLLFLDCVYQLTVQNPFAFEFTDELLLELYRDVCYCYHHTFVFDSVLERLTALYYCPKDLLLLSAFDFSLYLHSDARRLLRNEASTCQWQNSHPFPRRTNHPETIRSTSFIVDAPVAREPQRFGPEQYDYETIESPQVFSSNLCVDWRTINLLLWSKCYCRYDQNYLPTLREQQLLLEINVLKDSIEKESHGSRRHIPVDTFHPIVYANSWHPQSLDTRV